jgi:hypothetical protein
MKSWRRGEFVGEEASRILLEPTFKLASSGAHFTAKPDQAKPASSFSEPNLFSLGKIILHLNRFVRTRNGFVATPWVIVKYDMSRRAYSLSRKEVWRCFLSWSALCERQVCKSRVDNSVFAKWCLTRFVLLLVSNWVQQTDNVSSSRESREWAYQVPSRPLNVPSWNCHLECNDVGRQEERNQVRQALVEY